MRLFVGIRPDAAAEQALSRYVAGFLAGRVRTPVPGSNLHVTVRFVGEVAQSTLPAIRDALRQLRLPAPELSVEVVAGFPQRQPHTIVGLLAQDARLTQLVEAVNAALEPIVALVEKRPYIGHVTLARVDRRHLARMGELAGLRAGWRPHEFTLFESTQDDGKPTYRPLLAVPFDGSGG